MREYQLIRRDGLWHLTQQQARPPKRDELACHTSCGKWAEMKDGFQKGRPDCQTCAEHVLRFEQAQALDELVGPLEPEPAVPHYEASPLTDAIIRGCLDVEDAELEAATQRSFRTSRRRRLRA